MTELLARARGESRPAAGSSEPEDAAEEYPSYARLRGPRQMAFMLELRFANGDCEAFDYGLLGRVRFNRSTGLLLEFANGLVTIRGRNLGPVFEAVLTHRLLWVAAAVDPAQVARDPEACVVTAIDLDDLKPSRLA